MNGKKRFNYNDVELVRIIANKVCEEKNFTLSTTIMIYIDDIYDYKKGENATIEKIVIKITDWSEIKIEDRKEIYVNTEHLKNRIRQKIDDKRKRWNELVEESRRRQVFEEQKKREFKENFDKLTPEMKAFFYVATALGREYLQACKYQNNYIAPNPYYNNNFLDKFLL